MATASRSRSSSDPQRGAPHDWGPHRWAVALLVGLTLLLAACGGGDDGPGDRDDPTPPDSGAVPAGLPDAVALADAFIGAVGALPQLYLSVPLPADVLSGLQSPAGAALDPADSAQEVRLRELRQAAYAEPDATALDIVIVELLRHATPDAAARLIETVRADPPRTGEADAPLPEGLDPADAVARTIDPGNDPEASPLLIGASVHFATVTARDGNLTVRVRAVAGDADAALARATEAMTAELATLADARDGLLPPAVDTPHFPLLDAADFATFLPPIHEGLQGVNRSVEETSVTAQYVAPDGGFISLVAQIQADPGEALLTGVLIRTPDALRAILADAFRLQEEQPLAPPAALGEQAAALSARVMVQGEERWTDALTFRRGPIWVVIQGVGPRSGVLPIESLALTLDQILIAAFEN